MKNNLKETIFKKFISYDFNEIQFTMLNSCIYCPILCIKLSLKSRKILIMELDLSL